MFWLLSKKEFRKEFKKIKKSFSNVEKSLKGISINTKDNKTLIKENKALIESNNVKIARLEGSLAVLLNKSQVSVSKSLNKSQGKLETNMINKVRRNKKAIIINEINKLSPYHSVVEMFNIISVEKGLCSKASFYRYINYLKSQKLLEISKETE
jgi:hypothetical protein